MAGKASKRQSNFLDPVVTYKENKFWLLPVGRACYF